MIYVTGAVFNSSRTAWGGRGRGVSFWYQDTGAYGGVMGEKGEVWGSYIVNYKSCCHM